MTPFLVLTFPYGSCFPCLHSEGTEAEIDGAGITAEPNHNSLGIFWLFSFVFSIFLPVPATSLPLGTCWIQQVQLYQFCPLSPLVSGHLIKPLLQAGPASFPPPSILATEAEYCCPVASFQPYDSAHHLQLPGSWLCYSSWSLVSISAPFGLGFRILWNFDWGNPLLAHLVQIYVSFKERLFLALLFSLYLAIILNPQSHLIYTQFIIHLDYQKISYFTIFALTNL